MRYTAGEAIVRSMEIEGVEQVFGVIGSTTLDILDQVGRSKTISYIGTRHEEHAAHMAHGYARACGKPAVILSQSGAAVTNEVTGLVTALKCHIPMLAIGGVAPSTHTDSGHRHEVDQVGLMAKVTKWSARIPRGDRAAEFMQRAFRVAMTHPRGPVFLEVPTDVLAAESFEWEPPKSRNSYRASFQNMINSEAIDAAAKLISSAKRPVFVVGAGGEDEQMWEHLAALSEAHQISLCSTFGHGSAIPRTPLAVGSIGRGGSRAAHQLLSEADVVAVIGSRLSRYTTVPYYGFEYWPKAAQIIHVEADWNEIGRHRPVDVGIAGDCKEFLSRLRRALSQAVPDRASWRQRIELLKAEWNEERAARSDPPVHKDTGYFEPAAVYARLGDVLSKDTIFVNEVGSNPAAAFFAIDYGSPKGLMYTGTMAGLGFAMPGALGAKVANPDRPVVAMIGDGAFSLSLPALITAVEYQIPVQVLIFDNACWGAEKSHQQQWFDSHYVGSDLKTADLVGIARAIGADALRVKDLDELIAAMKDQPKANPRVLVVPTDPNRFPKVVPNIGAPARSFKS